MMIEPKVKEVCPCGASLEITGHTTLEKNRMISAWRKTHTRHANAIAKAAENAAHPVIAWSEPSVETEKKE